MISISRPVYYPNFHALLRCGISFWWDNESNTTFKLQKRVIRIISGGSKHTSCRVLFKDYNILIMASLYILEVALTGTKINWAKMYKFITLVHKESKIDMFNFAIQTFSGNV
jgi:hypothetical protein